MASVVRGCSYCGCPDGEKRLKTCGACRLAQYCCKECQKADYPRHKDACLSVREVASTPSKMKIIKREANSDKLLLEANILEINQQWDKDVKEHGRGILMCAEKAAFEKKYGTGAEFHEAMVLCGLRVGTRLVSFFEPVSKFNASNLSPSVQRWITSEETRDNIFCAILSSLSASGSTIFRLTRVSH